MKFLLRRVLKNIIPYGIVKFIEKKKYYNNYGYNLRNNEKNFSKLTKLNLCSGPVILDDYINLDISPNSDVVIDLEKKNLPFENNKFQVAVCISAINYFEKQRAIEILKEVHRVLVNGGIFRISTQCLDKLLSYYIQKDEKFFNKKNEDNTPRFSGKTYAEKLLNWFYGFETVEGHKTKYIYNYEILSNILREIGFKNIQSKNFLESKLEDVKKIDKRNDQCFIIECEK